MISNNSHTEQELRQPPPGSINGKQQASGNKHINRHRVFGNIVTAVDATATLHLHEDVRETGKCAGAEPGLAEGAFAFRGMVQEPHVGTEVRQCLERQGHSQYKWVCAGSASCPGRRGCTGKSSCISAFMGVSIRCTAGMFRCTGGKGGSAPVSILRVRQNLATRRPGRRRLPGHLSLTERVAAA